MLPERKGSLQLAATPLAAAGLQPCASPQVLPLSGNSLSAGRRHACDLPGGNGMGMPRAAPCTGVLGGTQGFGGVGRRRRRARWESTAHARPRRKLKPLYESEEEAAGGPDSGPGPDPLSP